MLRRMLAALTVAIVLSPAAAQASSGWARYDADTWVRWHARARVPLAGQDVTPAFRAELRAYADARRWAVHQARARHRSWLAARAAALAATRAAQAAAERLSAPQHQAPASGAQGGPQGHGGPPGGGDGGSVPGLIRAYFPASQERTALCVAWRESRYDPHAVNRYSGAAGVFQWMPRLWPWFAARAGWGGASVFSARANIAVAAWQVVHDGWWPWGGGC